MEENAVVVTASTTSEAAKLATSNATATEMVITLAI